MHKLIKAINILEKCEATSSRNSKSEYLESGENNRYLKKIFVLATELGVTYGIKIGKKEYESIKNLKPFLSPSQSFKSLISITKKLRYREVTGDEANTKVIKFLSHIPPKFRKWACRVINRKLDIGLQRATFSSIWEDLVCDFGTPLANNITNSKTKVIEWDRITFPCYGNPKVDGVNLSLPFKGKIPLDFVPEDIKHPCLTRGVNHYPMVEKLHKIVKKHAAKDMFICSEAYANWTKKEKLKYKSPWSKAMSLLKTGMTPVGFKKELITKEHQKEFDRDFVLYLFEYGKNTFYSSDHDYTDITPKNKRRKLMKELVKKINHPNIKIMPCIVLHNKKEALAYYKKCLSEGYEGIMLKDMNAPLINGRNDFMLKLKPEIDLDGIIVSILKGNGRNSKWAGSMKIYLPKYQSVPSCSVRTDLQRNDFWKRRKELIGVPAEFKAQKEPKGASVSDSRFIIFKRLREDLKKMAPTKISRLVGKHG